MLYSKKLRGYIKWSHGSCVVVLECVSVVMLMYKHRSVLIQAQGMDGEILSNRTKQVHFPLNWIVPKSTYGIPIMCSH